MFKLLALVKMSIRKFVKISTDISISISISVAFDRNDGNSK